MRVSAPLPTEFDEPIDWQNPQLIRDELVRAQVELMHAIDRHRRAWAKMERLKTAAELKGNAYFMDNERDWKLATGDVTWWRGEVSSRSNAVMALIQLATLMNLNLGPSWAEVTSFGEQARGARTFIRSDAPGRARCICNDPPPTVDKPKNGTATRPPDWRCPRHGEVI
jgi:hypothetical protein